MRAFINIKLHKKEEKIIDSCIELNVFNTHCRLTVKEKLFQIEKYGIQNEEIGWYTDNRRWVGPGRVLPWFIPQLWFRPAAYMHDITFIILNLIKRNKPTNFTWMTLEVSNNLFLAIAKSFKPRFIPWDSFLAKAYKKVLDEVGKEFV